MYYFYDEYLIRWEIGNGNIVAFDSLEYLDKVNYFKENFHNYKILFSDYVATEKVYQEGDIVKCKYGISCQSTGFVIKGSRTANGAVKHVSTPHNKNVPIEE